MSLEIHISPQTEARIRERAAMTGQNPETFVLEAVAEKLADAEETAIPYARDSKAWKEKLQHCIDLHPVTTHFVDDSRESIYAGRGE